MTSIAHRPAETVQFNAEGTTNYEIDLSVANAGRLRDQLAKFVVAATPVKSLKSPRVSERQSQQLIASNNSGSPDSEEGSRARTTVLTSQNSSRPDI
jgi:hypothetical protein